MNHDQIKEIIENIFKHTGCSITSCEISQDQDTLWCVVETPDSRLLIGRDGETLQSLNHLVRRMIDSQNETERSNLCIDINGYQKKHFDEVKAKAHMLSERARYFKSNVETEPLPAYDRRIIHLFLENVDDIETESTGLGKDRRVVVKYKENIL